MLCGGFSVADAFYAPVAFRFRTYGVDPDAAAGDYLRAFLTDVPIDWVAPAAMIGLDPHDVVAAGIKPVAGAEDIAAARAQIQQIRVDPAILAYIVAVVRATRSAPAVTLGVSPRGAAMVLHAAKAWAWLAGRQFVTPDEVKAVIKPCVRHRVQLRPELELEGTTVDGVLDGILASVPVPR